MKDEIDQFLGGLDRDTQKRQPSLSSTNETYFNPEMSRNGNTPEAYAAMEQRVDALFGGKYANHLIKRERPEHRLMLWLKLNGHSNKEVANTTGYAYHTVCQIVKQPWFVENFCRLSSEMGKDSVQTFLEGEVMGALERTVDLAKSADSDAVKMSANREILDRFLGKSVVKAEVKQAGTIDHVVHDAAALLEEQRKLDLQLHASGLSLAGRS